MYLTQPPRMQLHVPKPLVFLESYAVSYIFSSGNPSKYVIWRLFVVLGQYEGEDHVFACVLRLVFAWTTPLCCLRHDHCTNIRSCTSTTYVS